MRFYLEDLMTLDTFHGAEIIAGRSGINNKISAANILDQTYNLKNVKDEAFVLYTSDKIEGNAEKFLPLMDELAKLNVGAIGLKSNLLPEGLPEVVIEKADHLAIPIIILSDNFYYSDIVDKIRSHIFCHRKNEFIDQNDVHYYFNNIVNDKGLYGTSELLYKLTGFDVIIIYGYEKMQCPQNIPFENFDYDRAWGESEIIVTKNAIDTYEQEIRKYEVFYDGENRECAVAKLAYKEKIGYIWLIKRDRPFDESDYSLLRITAYWFDLVSEKLYEMQADEQRLKAEMINLLMSGGKRDWDEAIQKSQAINLVLPDRAYVVVLQQSGISGDEIIEKINNHFFTEYNRLAVVGEYGKSIVILIEESFGVADKVVQGIYESLHYRYAEGKFTLGIGRCVNYEDYAESYEEAKHAVRIGQAKGLNVADFQKLNLYRIISYTNLSKEMERFYNDYYLPLKSYDENHDSDLITTLRTYLDNGCSCGATASELHFHRNTILYRIQLIEKLCQVNLKTMEGLVNMGTALMIAPLMSEGNRK